MTSVAWCSAATRWSTSPASTSTSRSLVADEVRSFSMANLPGDELEFMIKIYPDGKFSSLLADGGLKEGDELEVTGPYGVFTLREKSERPLLFIGGGAGMAPILALLRSMAESGSEREAVYYYGARGRADLFHLEELAALESGCRTSGSCRRCRTAARMRTGVASAG